MEDASARDGIGSLKIRFNRVFGYYIEISKANSMRRRPTTTASRRLPEASASRRPAQGVRGEVLGADERILEREVEIYEDLRVGWPRSSTHPGHRACVGHAGRLAALARRPRFPTIRSRTFTR